MQVHHFTLKSIVFNELALHHDVFSTHQTKRRAALRITQPSGPLGTSWPTSPKCSSSHVVSERPLTISPFIQHFIANYFMLLLAQLSI